LLAHSVRSNPSALSENEFALVQQHPTQGATLIRRVHGLEDIALTVQHHHERFDSSGYTECLSGHAITIEAAS
jgi:response regulator RpfG family c-di-GMP phosphodiesterase